MHLKYINCTLVHSIISIVLLLASSAQANGESSNDLLDPNTDLEASLVSKESEKKEGSEKLITIEQESSIKIEALTVDNKLKSLEGRILHIQKEGSASKTVFFESVDGTIYQIGNNILLKWTSTPDGKGKFLEDGLIIKNIIAQKNESIRMSNTNGAEKFDSFVDERAIIVKNFEKEIILRFIVPSDGGKIEVVDMTDTERSEYVGEKSLKEISGPKFKEAYGGDFGKIINGVNKKITSDYRYNKIKTDILSLKALENSNINPRTILSIVKGFPTETLRFYGAVGAIAFSKNLLDPYLYGQSTDIKALHSFAEMSSSPTGLASFFAFVMASGFAHNGLDSWIRVLENKNRKAVLGGITNATSPFGSKHKGYINTIESNSKILESKWRGSNIVRAMTMPLTLTAGMFASHLVTQILEDVELHNCVNGLRGKETKTDFIDSCENVHSRKVFDSIVGLLPTLAGMVASAGLASATIKAAGKVLSPIIRKVATSPNIPPQLRGTAVWGIGFAHLFAFLGWNEVIHSTLVQPVDLLNEARVIHSEKEDYEDHISRQDLSKKDPENCWKEEDISKMGVLDTWSYVRKADSEECPNRWVNRQLKKIQKLYSSYRQITLQKFYQSYISWTGAFNSAVSNYSRTSYLISEILNPDLAWYIKKEASINEIDRTAFEQNLDKKIEPYRVDNETVDQNKIYEDILSDSEYVYFNHKKYSKLFNIINIHDNEHYKALKFTQWLFDKSSADPSSVLYGAIIDHLNLSLERYQLQEQQLQMRNATGNILHSVLHKLYPPNLPSYKKDIEELLEFFKDSEGRSAIAYKKGFTALEIHKNELVEYRKSQNEQSSTFFSEIINPSGEKIMEKLLWSMACGEDLSNYTAPVDSKDLEDFIEKLPLVERDSLGLYSFKMPKVFNLKLEEGMRNPCDESPIRAFRTTYEGKSGEKYFLQLIIEHIESVEDTDRKQLGERALALLDDQFNLLLEATNTNFKDLVDEFYTPYLTNDEDSDINTEDSSIPKGIFANITQEMKFFLEDNLLKTLGTENQYLENTLISEFEELFEILNTPNFEIDKDKVEKVQGIIGSLESDLAINISPVGEEEDHPCFTVGEKCNESTMSLENQILKTSGNSILVSLEELKGYLNNLTLIIQNPKDY